MGEHEIVFWDCDQNAEELSWDDKDEAIEHHLEDLPEPLPAEIEVYGWERMRVPEGAIDPDRVLEFIGENLLCEYASPEDGLEPTLAMEAAAKEFCRIIHTEFTPWNCEKVTTETVNVREWIEKNRPEWLEDVKIEASPSGARKE